MTLSIDTLEFIFPVHLNLKILMLFSAISKNGFFSHACMKIMKICHEKLPAIMRNIFLQYIEGNLIQNGVNRAHLL